MWKALPLLIAALGLQGQNPPAPAWSPPDSVRVAAADAARLPDASRVRYLDLGAVPPDEREALAKILSGHVNSLSREPDLVPPALVGGLVLRLNIDDYGWDAKVWESLADVSPYHHVRVRKSVAREEPWPGGVWAQDGRHYPAGAFRYKWTETEVQTALAPWLSEGPGGTGAAEQLVESTQSRAPIVSGPWFLWQTAISEGRKPGYYDFLRVKDRAGFEKLVRFDAELAKALEQRRVIIFSGVTQEPRRAERTNTVLGGLWRTFDSAEAVDKANPIRILDDPLKFDATEQFAPLPNGLPAWLLANGAGVRQDKAPDSVVAGDRTSPKDARLHINLSCIRCHFGGKESGVMEIDAAPMRELRTYGDKQASKLRELRRQYLRNISPLIEADRQAYAVAVRAASGLEIAKYGQEYSRWFRYLDDARVDAAWAGRDFGLSGANVVAALQRYDEATKHTGGLDPVVTVVMNGGRIPVRQYFESIPLFWTALKGGGK